MVKTGSDAFPYVGLDIKQVSSIIVTVTQDSYIDSLQMIDLISDYQRDKDAPVTEQERTKLRGAVGQLNWISCTSMPDIAFDVSVASSNLKCATVKDILSINKVHKASEK